MKTIFLFLVLTAFSNFSSAADYLDGYVVMANNDTVICKFKTKGFINSISFNRIIVTTLEGEEQVFRGPDKKIIGYGFIERGKRYDFLYIELKPKSESGFYQRIVNGDRYKLYVHVISSQTYPGVSTAMPQYVLFNPAGAFQKFETCLACPWRKQLRELLKDDSNALQHLEKASRLEITNFVQAINKGQ